jgi:hypothetical protein
MVGRDVARARRSRSAVRLRAFYVLYRYVIIDVRFSTVRTVCAHGRDLSRVQGHRVDGRGARRRRDARCRRRARETRRSSRCGRAGGWTVGDDATREGDDAAARMRMRMGTGRRRRRRRR